MILGSIVFQNAADPKWDELDGFASDEDHKRSLEIFYALLEEYRFGAASPS